VLQENLLKELGTPIIMTGVYLAVKNWKAVDGYVGMDGKKPSLVKVSASLWQAQKQILTYRLYL